MQYGIIGLISSLECYDPDNRHPNFEAYSRSRVRGEIIDGLRRLMFVPFKHKDNTSPFNFSSINDYRKSHSHNNGDGEGETIEASIEDKKSPTPLANLQIKDNLDFLTRGLSRDKKLVLILYYYENMTMKDTGKVMGVTESRICQLHPEIIAQIKQKLKDRNLNYADFAN